MIAARRVARELFGEDLDRDVALQLLVARAIDHAHTAFAEQGGEFVLTKDGADGD
jgi:hypothetical protein